MFHIKYKLKPSTIHGIGLFSEENVEKGRLIYSINKELDLVLTPEEYSKLTANERTTIEHYGYFVENKWHLAFDDVRFCNHSDDGNIVKRGNTLIAKRSIKIGEELTQYYKEFDERTRIFINNFQELNEIIK